MKIILCIIIVCLFGMAGYLYKLKLKTTKDVYEYLLDFENFVSSNISLFKNNLVDIITKFTSSMSKSKAKFNNLFELKNNIFMFNSSELSKYGVTKEAQCVISSYFNGLGKNEYEFEKEKNKNFEVYIKSKLSEATKVYEEKGNLYFKLLLLLGAVICIIIW